MECVDVGTGYVKKNFMQKYFSFKYIPLKFIKFTSELFLVGNIQL